MKILAPNYNCLQNPWLGRYRPQIPVLSVLCPQLNLLNPHRTKFLDTPLRVLARHFNRRKQVSVLCWIACAKNNLWTLKRGDCQKFHNQLYALLTLLKASRRTETFYEACSMILFYCQPCCITAGMCNLEPPSLHNTYVHTWGVQ